MDETNVKTEAELKEEALENAVVLECVDRLLTLGYTPGTLTLEKSFPNGHGATYLDIFVTKDDKSYWMIECKTFGEKYEDELTSKR